MFLRKDGTDMGEYDSDDSVDRFSTDTKGVFSITPKGNEQNTLFLLLIDLFQYAPTLFGIS